jgi:hypothetical protein
MREFNLESRALRWNTRSVPLPYRDRSIVVTMKNAQEDYEVPYYCCGTILKDDFENIMQKKKKTQHVS